MARSKIGICALCLQRRQLRQSHLLPRGVFKLLRNPPGPDRDPILITAKIALLTSKQPKDFLLCGNCERRFDTRGENYVLRQMKRRTRFPLLDRLRVSPSIDYSLKEGIYSGLAIGLEMEKFAYFALSVVWRAAVHEWRAPDGRVIGRVVLQSYEEPIRKYLLGESCFPGGVAIVVTACTDRESQNAAYLPTPAIGTPNTAISFLACGIEFVALLGDTQPPGFKHLCCFSSPRQLVFSRDYRRMTLHAFSKLVATAKEIGVSSHAKNPS